MEAVSILMPAYNAGKFIGEAIASVLTQSYTEWELVIVNDGSTDNTEAVIALFSDNRIKYFKNDQNRGLVYTRNRLLDLAQYDLLAFLDSDDIAARDRLRIQVDFLRDHPQTGLVAGSLYGLQDGRVDKKSFVFDLPENTLPAHLLFYNPVSTSSVMFRRSALPDVRFRDDYPPVEDYDLWTRMIYTHKGAVLKDILGHYRLHAGSISKQLSGASYENRNKVVLNQLKHYFGGEYTGEEMNLHLSLADLDMPCELEDVEPIRDWVLKLIRWNSAQGPFHQQALQQILFERVLKRFLRMQSYDMRVHWVTSDLKARLKPRMRFELWKKAWAISAFSAL